MIFWMFSSMIIAFILTLPLCLTPLTLGLWIWLLAFTLAITIVFLSNTWFALMLFLIYIGGLLVMFAYFSALAPNQKMFMKQLVMTLIPPIMLMLALIYSFGLFSMSIYSLKFSLPVNLLMNMYTLSILAIILFMVMVAVAKTAAPKFGPLRPFKMLYVQTNSKIPPCY